MGSDDRTASPTMSTPKSEVVGEDHRVVERAASNETPHVEQSVPVDFVRVPVEVEIGNDKSVEERGNKS